MSSQNQKKERKPIVIGFGELEDPLPDHPQVTRYRIFAGACPECGCSGRKLLPEAEALAIFCDKCRAKTQTNIHVADYGEVTYIYWCNSSKFSSDCVELSPDEVSSIEKCLAQFNEPYEPPHWAVLIVSGRCSCSESCINYDCIYLVRSQ